jgi:hypothetical protein
MHLSKPEHRRENQKGQVILQVGKLQQKKPESTTVVFIFKKWKRDKVFLADIGKADK